MNLLRRWVHRLLGRDERYHRQASELSARNLDSERRKRRVERLTAEYELYRRRHPHAE